MGLYTNNKSNRNNIEQIANEMDGKTLEEVQEYSKVFWKRYKELNGNLIIFKIW